MKSLHLLLSVLGLSVLISCKKSGYELKDGSVYYNDFLMRSADYDSFQELNAIFAEDKTYGYYRGIPLDESTGAGFYALDEHYARDNTAVFYCDNYIDFKLFETRRKNKISRVAGADSDTFQPIAYDYAKDKFRVYYQDIGFAVIDVTTFKPLDHSFGKDKEVGYFQFKPIPGSNGSSFTVLSRNFSKDNRVVYYSWNNLDRPLNGATSGIQAIKNADPSSFTVVGLYYAIDKDHAFYEGNSLPVANPRTFKQWSDAHTDYAHDSAHVYYQNRLIAAADKATFSLLADAYAQDKTTIFYKANPLPGADRASFSTLDYGYAKDTKWVYYAGNVLAGADPISFMMVSNEAERDAADKAHSYDAGRRVTLTE